MRKPKILSRRKITNERWLNLYENKFRHNDKEHTWIYASRKRGPECTLVRKADAVVIVPILVEEDGTRKLVVIKEYRAPLEDYEYHFPAGLLEDGEQLVTTAARELKEETGLILGSVQRISPLLSSSAGMTDECSQMVFCECIRHPNGKQELEESENIEVMLLDYKQVVKLAKDEEKYIAAKSWPVFYLIEQLGKI